MKKGDFHPPAVLYELNKRNAFSRVQLLEVWQSNERFSRPYSITADKYYPLTDLLVNPKKILEFSIF